MMLFVTARFKDNTYCVLDIDTGIADKVSVEFLSQKIKEGYCANAKLKGKRITGTLISFTLLPYLDTVKQYKKVVLYKTYCKGALGYVVCLTDGSGAHFEPIRYILGNLRDYMNVSNYLSKSEATELYSLKGYCVPSDTEIWDYCIKRQEKYKTVLSKVNNQNKQTCIVQKSGSISKVATVGNSPRFNIDMTNIKQKRQEELSRIASERDARVSKVQKNDTGLTETSVSENDVDLLVMEEYARLKRISKGGENK